MIKSQILNYIKTEIYFKLNIWTFTSIILCLFIIIPIAVIGFQFGIYSENWNHIKSTVLNKYIFSTIILVIGTSFLSAIIGVLCAFFVSFCKFPGRKFFEWGLILPLTIPTYIAAYSYYDILEIFNPLMLLIRERYSIHAMNLFNDILVYICIILILTSVLFPYVYLSTRASFLSQGNNLIEAAKTLGFSQFRIFWKVILPLSRPAIIAGLSLVIMETLNDYGAVEYFGIPTFTVGIFRSWLGMNDLDSALKLSIYLLSFIFIFLYIEKRSRGNAKFDQSNDSGMTHKYISLNLYQEKLIFILCFIPFSLGFIIPVSRLSIWAISASPDFFDLQLLKIIINSILLALITSPIIVVLSIFLLFTTKYYKSHIVQLFNKFAILGYSMPGAVIAIGMLMIYSSFNRFTDILITGTIISLIFAYIVRFLAVSWQPIDSNLEKKCSDINEAARDIGNSPIKTLFKLNIPLIQKSIFISFILVFIDIFKELPLTLILRPFNFDTLATLTFDLNKQAQIYEAAIPALIIIFVTIFPVIILNKKIEGKI